MSSNFNNTFRGSTTTYQSIIIALVAGAILVIALFSLLYRRRRRLQFLAQVDRARNARDERFAWVELGDGRMIQVQDRENRRGKKKGVGRQPMIWDAGLGNKSVEDYEDETVGDDEGSLHREKAGGDDEREEVNVDGSFGEEWKPLSATIPDYSAISRPTTPTSLSPPTRPGGVTRNVDLSILIAMPTPYSIPRSASSSTSSLSYSKPPHLDDYPVEQSLPPDTEYPPLVEIGYTSTRVRVNDNGASAWEEITSDIDIRQKRHKTVSSSANRSGDRSGTRSRERRS